MNGIGLFLIQHIVPLRHATVASCTVEHNTQESLMGGGIHSAQIRCQAIVCIGMADGATAGKQLLALGDDLGGSRVCHRRLGNGFNVAEQLRQGHLATAQFQADDTPLVTIIDDRTGRVRGKPATAAPTGQEGNILFTVNGITDRRGNNGGADEYLVKHVP